MMSEQRAHRKLEGRVVIATHNPGKLREMKELLAPYGIAAVSAGELGLAEPDETGTTFLANAEIKARAATEVSGLPSFADDSGLCVDALGGDPGIYSARWAKETGDFPSAMGRITDMLSERGAIEPAQRRAHFVSALAICWPDGHLETFEGKVFGFIDKPRGEKGFGYDPFFQPDGRELTFGEMSSEEKHGIPADGSEALSHRARAFQMLARACLG